MYEKRYKKNNPITISKLLRIPKKLDNSMGENYLLIKGTIALYKPAHTPCKNLTTKNTVKF